MLGNEDKRVAVIVPIYRVKRELVQKCIESILKQSYTNLEIILVDDGNEREYVEFLNGFLDCDDRIKMVRHEINRGLYRARLTGYENADSDFIAFVDADDSISIDWIRLLVARANDTKADIVMGNTICEDENHWRYVFNRNVSINTKEDLLGEDVFHYLAEDCGLDFMNHTVWNKLYTRDLWDSAWDDLNKIDKHLVMTEDIAFSFVLFYYANKMSFLNKEGYFYYRNAESSTINTNGIEKAFKNVSDLALVFDFVSDFMMEKGLLPKYERYWKEWKNRYFRWWSFTIKKLVDTNAECGNELKELFFDTFEKKEFENTKPSDSFFDGKKITWNCQYENIKGAIMSNKIQAISFDLFDTLITRPVLNPEDVYEFVMDKVDLMGYDRATIKTIRKLSEQFARNYSSINNPMYEDVTLHEVYLMMEKRYDIPNSLCTSLENEEKNIEVDFAAKREAGYELYDLACHVGKKIYITSDMYLEKDTIERILEKTGYARHEELLLSSSERLLKSSGHLFDVLIKKSKCEAEEIMHIGDNWNVDYLTPKEKGIQAYFIPKTKDILYNSLGDAYTGNSLSHISINSNSVIDNDKHFDNLQIRSMYAVIANKLFDNPFVYFSEDTDYNSNPYYLGFMTLGMHYLGITKWLLDLCQKNEYDRIHFSSRDGFFLKRVMDYVLSRNRKSNIRTNYLYISRKAFIPIEIRNRKDLNKIVSSCSMWNNTPLDIINRYQSVLRPLSPEIREEYFSKGYFLDRKFTSEDEFVSFVNLMGEIQFSQEIADSSYRDCSDYLRGQVLNKDVVFDLGYSGKLHKNIVDALGMNVHGAYISKDGYSAAKRIAENGLFISSYYDYKPTMQGIVNEYILSDRGPSCVGYSRVGDDVVPVFEEMHQDYVGDYVVNEINRGALDFVKAYFDSLDKYFDSLLATSYELSLPFEKFLINPQYGDSTLFDCCIIEDEFFGGITEKPLNEIWNWHIKEKRLKYEEIVKTEVQIVEKYPDNMVYEVYKNNIINKSAFIKGLYWLCIDRAFFRKRISEKVRGIDRKRGI